MKLNYKLTQGDYYFNDDGSIAAADYYEELLDRVVMNLKAQRGRFYPNKDFGSFISVINCTPYGQYALAFAQQALDGIDGAYVGGIRETDNGFVLKIFINRREYEVSLNDVR